MKMPVAWSGERSASVSCSVAGGGAKMNGKINRPSVRPNAVPRMPPVRKIRTPRQNLRIVSIRRRQAAHREFDAVAGQFTPAFDRGHIGGLGIAREYLSRLGAG